MWASYQLDVDAFECMGILIMMKSQYASLMHMTSPMSG